jgi:hypothetical protein
VCSSTFQLWCKLRRVADPSVVLPGTGCDLRNSVALYSMLLLSVAVQLCILLMHGTDGTIRYITSAASYYEPALGCIIELHCTFGSRLIDC